MWGREGASPAGVAGRCHSDADAVACFRPGLCRSAIPLCQLRPPGAGAGPTGHVAQVSGEVQMSLQPGTLLRSPSPPPPTCLAATKRLKSPPQAAHVKGFSVRNAQQLSWVAAGDFTPTGILGPPCRRASTPAWRPPTALLARLQEARWAPPAILPMMKKG